MNDDLNQINKDNQVVEDYNPPIQEIDDEQLDIKKDEESIKNTKLIMIAVMGALLIALIVILTLKFNGA